MFSARVRGDTFRISGGVGAVADGHLLCGDRDVLAGGDGPDGEGAARCGGLLLEEDDERAVLAGGSRGGGLHVLGDNRAINVELDRANIASSINGRDVSGNPDLDVFITAGAECQQVVKGRVRAVTDGNISCVDAEVVGKDFLVVEV